MNTALLLVMTLLQIYQLQQVEVDEADEENVAFDEVDELDEFQYVQHYLYLRIRLHIMQQFEVDELNVYDDETVVSELYVLDDDELEVVIIQVEKFDEVEDDEVDELQVELELLDKEIVDEDDVIDDETADELVEVEGLVVLDAILQLLEQ